MTPDKIETVRELASENDIETEPCEGGYSPDDNGQAVPAITVGRYDVDELVDLLEENGIGHRVGKADDNFIIY